MTAPTGWLLLPGENQYWKPHSGGEAGTGARKKEDCTLFKKKGFHIMNKKNEDIL